MIDHNKNIKIYSFTDSREPFSEIDYKTGLSIRLHPKKTFIQGELQSVEYYSAFDGTTYSDLVLKVDIVYTRDALGFATTRTTTRTWYYTDDTIVDVPKVTIKHYNDALDRIKEGKRRRANLIDILINNVMGLMLETMIPGQAADATAVIQTGRDFMKTHQIDITAFVQESHTDFKDSVTAASDAWLSNTPASIGGSTTIKDYITTELTI